MQKIVRRPILNPRQRSIMGKIFWAIFIIAAIFLVLNLRIELGGRLNTGEYCYGSQAVNCSAHFTYDGAGKISLNVTQNLESRIYNVVFFCNINTSKTAASPTAHNWTLYYGGAPMENTTMVESIPYHLNVTCFDNDNAISASHGSLFYTGSLYMEYNKTPNGVQNYHYIGRIYIGGYNLP